MLIAPPLGPITAEAEAEAEAMATAREHSAAASAGGGGGADVGPRGSGKRSGAVATRTSALRETRRAEERGPADPEAARAKEEALAAARAKREEERERIRRDRRALPNPRTAGAQSCRPRLHCQ